MSNWLHWSPGWWLVVDALAVYRLSRLVARDSAVQPFRRWLGTRFEGPLVELVGCIWCLSVYFSGLAILLTYFAPYAWSFPASGLAMSAVAGLLGERA